jgi:hypothetical protein
MNSQVIQLSPLESKFLNGRSVIQTRVRDISSYNIPFNVLESANLSLDDTEVLEQGPEGTFEIKGPKGKMEERHFTGALLLANNGRKFLMDIDREEINHKIFNVFFVEVSSHVTSISEAYDSMVPEEVKELKKQGVEVIRQGEFFYIRTGEKLKISEDSLLSWEPRDSEALEREFQKHNGTMVIRYGSISHGKGRPNNCMIIRSKNEFLNGLIAGSVTHSGREHREVDLGINYNMIRVNEETKEETRKQVSRSQYDKRHNYQSGLQNFDIESIELDLWRVVPNTTVSNFTIKGDVD